MDFRTEGVASSVEVHENLPLVDKEMAKVGYSVERFIYVVEVIVSKVDVVRVNVLACIMVLVKNVVLLIDVVYGVSKVKHLFNDYGTQQRRYLLPIMLLRHHVPSENLYFPHNRC